MAGVSRIATDLAESIVALVTGVDVQVRAHTGDPGADGTANAATGIDPQVVAPADWGSFAADTDTADYGGRVTETEGEIDYGTATAAETVSWLSLWHEGETPDTFDTWRLNIQLSEPKGYTIGDPVTIPMSELALFGSGSYPMAEA